MTKLYLWEVFCSFILTGITDMGRYLWNEVCFPFFLILTIIWRSKAVMPHGCVNCSKLICHYISAVILLMRAVQLSLCMSSVVSESICPLPLLTGGYIIALKTLWGLDAFSWRNFWVFCCISTRVWDCLMMHYFFVNIKASGIFMLFLTLLRTVLSVVRTQIQNHVSILCSPLKLHLPSQAACYIMHIRSILLKN